MNSKCHCLILLAALGWTASGHAGDPIPETAVPAVIVNTDAEPIAPGKFQPTWDSLRQYQTPDWFRMRSSASRRLGSAM